MAKGVQIPIEVVDKFSKQLADMDSRLNQISKSAEKQQSSFNLLSADIVTRYGREALGAVVEFGKASIKSFADSEAGNARLQVAMRNLGVYTDAQYAKQLRLSEALQQTTVYSNDEVTAIQTKLTSFGLWGKELEKVTRLTLDLAAGQKISAEEAAQLLGRAYAGQTTALSRLGITFSDTGDRARNFEAIQEVVQRRFGGSAVAEVNTYEGRVKQLANAYDDIKKKIGADLVGASGQGAGGLLGLALAIDKNYEAIKRVAAVSMGVVSGPVGAVISLAKDWTGVQTAAEKAYEAGNKAMAAAREKQKAAPPPPVDLEAEASRLKRAQEIDDAEWTAAETGRIKAQSFLMTSEQLKTLAAEDAALELERFGNTEEAKRVMTARTVEIERALNASRIANISSTLNFISTLQHAKSKEFVAIGKAAAIIDTTIHTAVAVMGAYRAFSWIPLVGPALGAAAAAIVATAGAAQIAQISGLQLKEGAFVPGSASGVQATIGEAGRDEAVIPLENGVAMRRIGRAIADAGGSGGRGNGVNVTFGDISIVVQGQALAGNIKSLAAQLADEFKTETEENIKLAIRLTQTATLNAGLAA